MIAPARFDDSHGRLEAARPFVEFHLRERLLHHLGPSYPADLIEQAQAIHEIKPIAETLRKYGVKATSRTFPTIPPDVLEDSFRCIREGLVEKGLQPWNPRTAYRAVAPSWGEAENLALELASLTDDIGRAYVGAEPTSNPEMNVTSGPCPFAATRGPDFTKLQGYLDPVTGIDAKYAWGRAGGRGDGVGLVDIEYDWEISHEDIDAHTYGHWRGTHGSPHGTILGGQHGTSTLGVIAGESNGLGVTGSAHKLGQIILLSHVGPVAGTQNFIAECLWYAIALKCNGILKTGDVILIEAQLEYKNLGGVLTPVEYAWSEFYSIQSAVFGAGLVVIEAAGNSNTNLDQWPFLQIQPTASANDSGAIMVGGSEAKLPYDRVDQGPGKGSNYGSRVDCFAWGRCVVTAGVADEAKFSLSGGGKKLTSYRMDFRGTSSASAIIAGAVVSLQGMADASGVARPSPTAIRDAFRQYGTKQGGTVPGHIGLMPDLRQVCTALKI